MLQFKKSLSGAGICTGVPGGTLLHKSYMIKKAPKSLLLLLFFFIFAWGLFAQTEYDFPRGDFWSLDGGFGISNTVVAGISPQLLIDPKLWLSPKLMVGSKVGINYSFENDNPESELRNLLTFEVQVYLRWNFLQFGKKENPFNLYVQPGIGLLSVYRGTKGHLLTTVTETRGSVLGDLALGITIPINQRWHIDVFGRGGYPHLWGAGITTGFKFPLPEKTVIEEKTSTTTVIVREREAVAPRTEYLTEYRTEYVEVIRTLPPEEIVKMIKIFAVEFVLFGPDVGRYNIGIDRDAQQLNELVLEYTAQTLKDNPNYRVRLEGHANPYTINPSEIDELQVLSAMRANNIAAQLINRGVREEQIVVISFGGARTATSDWDVRNRNRRVELIIIEIGL